MAVVTLSETNNAKSPSFAAKPAATMKHVMNPTCIIIYDYMIHNFS